MEIKILDDKLEIARYVYQWTPLGPYNGFEVVPKCPRCPEKPLNKAFTELFI